MTAAISRTLRHWPFPFLIPCAAYFAYRLATEPCWLTWACVAMIAAGFLLNLSVIVANGGFMPAAVAGDDIPPENRDRYRPIDGSTRLRVIADWIDVGPWLLSPGDLLLAAAVVTNVIGRLAGLC